MKRSTNQNGASPTQNTAHLLSTMSSAAENNSRVRNNTLSMRDKVESARRHLSSHQRQFHTGEDSSSGESVENRSPHVHAQRSHSSPRNVTSGNAVKSRSTDKHTSSVLYSAELQHARRVSGDTRKRNFPLNKDVMRVSPSKPISPARRNDSFRDQLHDITVTSSPRRLTVTSSPPRRSTYVVSGKRDSYRGDATFTAHRRETYTIDRRDETTVSHDGTVIAPGLLEEEFHPRKRDRAHSHGSSSVFHSKCIPKDAHPHEVSNVGKWDVEFLPGSLINARKIEKDRRSAAVDLLSPNAESLRYQEERTRREEIELMRLVREQSNGRSTKEIFDSWVPLDEERRKKKERHGESSKKSTRRLWEAEENENEEGRILGGIDRLGRERERRIVMEDEAGYAMPLPRNVDDQSSSVLHRTPRSPREPSPDEQFFTPIAPTPRLSRVSGVNEKRKEDGETPILGRHSTRFSSTFIVERSMDRNVRRLRGGSDKADGSVDSSLNGTPDRRDETIEGREGGERSMGEYATPIGRRGEDRDGRRREGETSFLNESSCHDRSRGALNESMNAFERSLNRSLDHLSSLATRLTTQLETSKANISAIAAPSREIPLRREEGERLEGVAGERRLGMEASILGSLPPMREERNSEGGNELRRMMDNCERRSSLPDQRRDEQKREEERIQRVTSPIPAPRTTIPSSSNHHHPPSSSTPLTSVHGLASLLDANLGRMERSEGYEREAHRLERVVTEMSQSSINVKNEVREKPTASLPAPLPATLPPPIPSPRSFPTPLPRSTNHASHPNHQLAIETAGGRDELMEMYEARHRNWHRRGDDIAVPSPRSSGSRSPSPLPPSLSNLVELRERQSVQGMLDQRAKAVRGAFLHLLQRLYTARFERRYDERQNLPRSEARDREFAEEQKREEESFKREANEAKMKAIDSNIKYRDLMQWLKEESKRMEGEIEYEVEMRERRRWERKMKEGKIDQSLLDSSRLEEANKLLDERARKALRASMAAQKHLEKREEVRRLEKEARKAVAFAEIPSSARSSIDDASFLLHQSMRRYSTGNEPLRVTSARGVAAETSFNASRDVGKSHEESQLSIGRDGKMREMKERLEEKRRQAEGVGRAMVESERRMNEIELVSVAAQLAAHDEYIRGVERVGRVIAENVQPHSPTGLPPGVEPLDLSSLDVEVEEGGEGKNSIEKSTDISEKKGEERSSISSDSLDGRVPPSIPSTLPSTQHSKSSTSTSSSSSSNKTLRATEELSRMLEEITVEEEAKESTVVEEEKKMEEDTVEGSVQFSPLREELDRSLPSTAASTGRQNIDILPPIDTVSFPETTVPDEIVPLVEVSSGPIETPQVPAMDTVYDLDEQESIPEEIVDDTVERSTVPSRALFSPIESSTTHSEESESSSERGVSTVTGGRSTVGQKKESIEEESSEETEEEKTLEVSTASLKKAISVASEMANPFDGFESSEEGSRRSEEREKEEIADATSLSAAVTTSTTTGTSLDVTTVVEKIPTIQREEEDEISWGDGGGLEVGGGSARSADFDWGSSVEEKESGEKKEEQTTTTTTRATMSIEKEENEEGEEKRPIGRLASLKERLDKISAEEDEEKKMSSPSSSSTATSSSRSSSSKTTSTDESTSEGTESSSGKSSERKDEREEEEVTPRAAASVSGGLSSASGSIDFDGDANLSEDVTSSRTPRIRSISRFRLSLNESFDSPRQSANKSSIANGRVMGAGSPRAVTPTSPHTPRAVMISPSGVASPDGRRSRFSAVMPLSPRSGRRSTSPKNVSLSREVSFALDDSSFGDISRLSAVELPTNTGGMNSMSQILSSLPPIASSSLPSIIPSRPSIGNKRLSIEEGDELEESVYESLMDVQTPVASVLSSLPIGHLIEKDKDEEVSPPLSVSARSSDNEYEQWQGLNKKEFVQPRVEKEVDEIWKTIEKKGYFTKEDMQGFEEMDLEKEEKDENRLRNERIRLIRKVSCELAASRYPRDERRMEDGRSIPREIVPTRRLRPSIEKRRLVDVIEKELLPQEAPIHHVIRMKTMGVEFGFIPIEEKILYPDLYADEEDLFQSGIERGEIMEVLLKL